MSYTIVSAYPLRTAVVMYVSMYQDEVTLGITGTAADVVLHSRRPASPDSPLEGRIFHRITPLAGGKQLEVPSHYVYVGTVQCTEYGLPWSIFESPARSAEPWPASIGA